MELLRDIIGVMLVAYIVWYIVETVSGIKGRWYDDW